MSGHEIDQHLKSLADISEILTAMNNLSKIEIHRLSGFIDAQNQLKQNIQIVVNDFLQFNSQFIQRENGNPMVVLLLGSERGFCGNINETLLAHLQTKVELKNQKILLIPVGYKLQNKLETDERVVEFIPGASAVEEIQQVLFDIIATLQRVTETYGPIQLSVLHLDQKQHTPIISKVLPAFTYENVQPVQYSHPPLSYLQSNILFTKLLDEYVFTSINSILYNALMIENQQRNQHLNIAVNHLTDKINHLKQKRNEIRQEEITEEIEVIMLGSDILMEK